LNPTTFIRNQFTRCGAACQAAADCQSALGRLPIGPQDAILPHK
jgi:hypothetical protein